MAHSFLPEDEAWMREALSCAAQAGIETSPNPRVGCVLVREGRQIGAGWTQPVGQAHAEVMALRDAAAHGEPVEGATAYVTLEPCSHFGRTPPCARALVEARLGRVVAAMQDPNPLVSGQGLQLLREAGVRVSSGLLADEARELNLGFFSRMQRQRPWVRVKVAASADGMTALENGVSQWITGAEARADGHRFRAQADVILSGIGTVLADDPRLDVRGFAHPRQPLKVIVDSRMRTPPTARLFESGHTLIAHALADDCVSAALARRGAEMLSLPSTAGQVDLHRLLAELARRQVNLVHVEAGARLNGALLEHDLVDEWVFYLAPKMLGGGRGMATRSSPLVSLADMPALTWLPVRTLGADLCLRARRMRDPAEIVDGLQGGAA